MPNAPRPMRAFGRRGVLLMTVDTYNHVDAAGLVLFACSRAV